MEKRKRAELLSLSLSLFARVFSSSYIFKASLFLSRQCIEKERVFVFPQRAKIDKGSFRVLLPLSKSSKRFIIRGKNLHRKKRERETKENETRFHDGRDDDDDDERKKRREKEKKKKRRSFFFFSFRAALFFFLRRDFHRLCFWSLFFVLFFGSRERGKKRPEK